MPRLSLSMIVKDEAVHLPRCLKSVQGLVDEMIILDTGSRDRTPELARDFGATVFSFPWQDDFAAARNAALTHVTGDWVLVLDADEVLVPEIIPLLKDVICPADHVLVNLLRREIGAAQAPYSLVSRLFRRHPDLSFDRPYHAIVDERVAALLRREPHWQVVALPEVALIHEGYRPTAIAGKDKTRRAQRAMERFYTQHPRDPYVCSKLGALYVETGEVKRGTKLLEQGLKSVHRVEPPLRYELHYHLGIAYTALLQPILARKHYEQAVHEPILPQLKLGAYNNLGSLLQRSGDLTAARRAFETTITLDPGFALGYYNLGLTLKAQGQLEEAVTRYQQSLTLDPDHAAAHQNLGVTLYKLGRTPPALTAFRQAILLYEGQNSPEAERLRRGLQDLGLVV
ncbi:tetratricopeptide repeat protein [Anthocerotibacter panamensis]|uniref:tetratricopeptide repeat protein n=1 Tax=Anthocerotibacter panamensis TaxID=2857077 RepID=UPI001C40791B|nr:tetratricopeptide repeat protein [Anthocerotibacter panamensis]